MTIDKGVPSDMALSEFKLASVRWEVRSKRPFSTETHAVVKSELTEASGRLAAMLASMGLTGTRIRDRDTIELVEVRTMVREIGVFTPEDTAAKLTGLG